jgi:hypothetical protein
MIIFHCCETLFQQWLRPWRLPVPVKNATDRPGLPHYVFFIHSHERRRVNRPSYWRRLVKWVPCHHGMARPQVAVGGNCLQIRRVAANISNKQSRTADRGWSSSLGIGLGLTTPHHKLLICYETGTTASDKDGFFDTTQAPKNVHDIWQLAGGGGEEWIQLAQDRDRWRAVVNGVMNLRVLAPRS